MRHKVAGRRLSRTKEHRLAMRRNMVSSLIEHETISTTIEKAKEVKPFAEKLITLAKKGSLSARRRAIALLGNRAIIGIEDGLVQNIGKVRGYDNAIDLIKKNIPNILEGRRLDFIAILHALMPDEAYDLKDFIMNQPNPPKKCEVYMLGPVLGAHMGPYALGVGWIGNWDNNWWKG